MGQWWPAVGKGPEMVQASEIVPAPEMVHAMRLSMPLARGAGTLIPSAQRLVWAAKQPLGNAALGALFA